MPRCPKCSSEVPEGNRFCGSCGSPLSSPTATPTETRPDTQAPTPVPPEASGGAPASDQGRFLPGATLAGRYRVIGLLGRGGMGEVYRADDLKLGQAVALKFLPAGLDSHAGRLARFLGEVKLARQVAHPNVCRVFDVGDASGQHFLSMEYVDGEDLASLLRRIGRLPRDKAIQIARQLCAGLAAAHAQGILHRDLKPANVMIDGRGHVRLTDFGLAAMAEDVDGAEIASGTPAYMAPEQLAGREVSVASDVYALGLVLYELFTGQPAFGPDDVGARQRGESAPESPASLVDGLDPAVTSIIMRCLERQPGARPESALAVSAALPGGDPLAAALAAGETPSPETVAAAGESGGMRPALTAGILALTLAGMAAIVSLYDWRYLAGQLPFEKPPEALATDARELLESLGYEARPRDRAWGFEYDRERLAFVRGKSLKEERDKWQRLVVSPPSPVTFWYRESPGYLLPLRFDRIHVVPEDPPSDVSGMASVRFDPAGRLVRFQAVPPQVVDATTGGSGVSVPETSWQTLFDRAELDPSTLAPTESTWTPPVYSDARRAWEGAHPSRPDLPIRIEAAAYRGQPVYFEIVMPWTEARRMDFEAEPAAFKVLEFVVLLIVLSGAVLLARANLRRGRGDRRGAWRLAVFWFAVNSLVGLFGADHMPAFGEARLFLVAMTWGVVTAAMIWLVYIALEPHVRRLWPEILISWARLLTGRLRDPLVGRDILVGALVGVVLAVVWSLAYLVAPRLGAPVGEPISEVIGGFPHGVLSSLTGPRQAISYNLFLPQWALSQAMIFLFLLLLVRVLLRRPRVTVAVYFLIAMSLEAVVSPLLATAPGVALAASAIAAAAALFVLLRFGFLALNVALMFRHFDSFAVLDWDLSTWYAGRSLMLLAVLAGIAVYGFYVSLAGRPLLAGLEED